MLARKVLLGETNGYRNHPQLVRFREQADPAGMLDVYLMAIYDEAVERGYSFEREKIRPVKSRRRITVTDGQLEYEFEHLKKKLRERDPERYENLKCVKIPRRHPLFRVIKGDVEPWEKTGRR